MVNTTAKWENELERWLEPFLDCLGHKARRRMCPLYVSGLIGPGDRKSVQPMAERLAPGNYDQLHHFVAAGVWDAAPLETELLTQADLRASGQQPVSAPPFCACRRAVCFDVRRVDHLRVRGSPTPGKLPEQIFPDAATRPTHETVID